MSRTLNDMPWPVQERKRERWRSVVGFPGAYGGAWPGRKLYAKYRNRSYRYNIKSLIRKGEEDSIQDKILKTVAYDIW